MSEAARRLLAEGGFGDEPLRRSAAVQEALPVVVPGAGLHSWFVPLTVGDRLAAFFQFLPDATLMRFSSFPRRPGGYADCPPAADWLDPDRIRGRAEASRRAGETAGDPILTFDRTPDKLVWAVPLTGPGGDAKYVYVAGEHVYPPPPADTFG